MAGFDLEELDIKTKLENNLLYIPNYDELSKKLLNYLDTRCFKNLIIRDSLDLKDVKKKRSSLNKLLNSISRTRIDTLKVIKEPFENQLKLLEKAIKETSDILGENIKKFEEENKPKIEEETTPPIYTLCIYSLDKKVLKQIEKIAKENNLKTELKGDK